MQAEEKQEVAGIEDTYESADQNRYGDEDRIDPLDPESRQRLKEKQSSRRKKARSTTTELVLASRRQQDEREFSTHIKKAMREVAKALALPWGAAAAESSR